MKDPYVVTVDFHLAQGGRAAFRALIDENARLSVEQEPGCRRFDVLEPEGDADKIVVYEIYDDADAFASHLQSQHFLGFNAASQGLCISKTVNAFALVCSAASEARSA